MARPTPYRRGQSLVELAFVLPTLLLLILSSVDLGRAFYESIAIQGAAEVGSLVATKYERNQGDPTFATGNKAVTDAIESATGSFVQIQDSDIDVSGIPWQPNTSYTIRVTRKFTLLTPFLGNVLGGQTLTLRSEVQGLHNCSTASC